MFSSPMEWIRYLCTVCRQSSLVIMATWLAATSAHSAVLRLNPDDNADNVITFDGAFTATVVQSAAGIDISIPGVTFTLDCQGEPTDSCTVSIGSSASSSSPAATTPPPAPISPDSDPAPSGDDACDGKSGFGTFGCEDDDGAGTSSPPAGSAADDSTADDSNSGSDVPASNNQDDDTAGNTGWGNLPSSSSSGSGESPTREAFPADNRADYSSSPNLGSGGGQKGGNTYTVALGLKTVTVLPLTMSSANVSGGIGFFEPTTAPTGSDLALWVSTSQDGGAVSGCSYYGGFDGQLRISTTSGNTASCILQPGSSYYLNVAACVRGSGGDYACRNGAQTGYEPGNVYLNGTW